MKRIKYLFPLVLLIAIFGSCRPKAAVDLSLSSNKVAPGDSIKVTVVTEKISTLLLYLGDSTTFSYNMTGNSTTEIKHAYTDTGTYLVRAIGYSTKNAFSDYDYVDVE